ncbi:protein YLS7-like [Pistacia vera]|uniref:protein YLS7-like n=1 Tax=Pistacia vera TaxID=55513 RepID=UPI0012635D25|nr:protein YLS7-like [Pistacia vera]XP_031274495.1 protein YLS7-like [Pistacia vera]
MTLASSGSGASPVAFYPRTLSSIAIAVGGLAMFLMFASWVLVSYPVGSTVHIYFYGFEKRLDISSNQTNIKDFVDAIGQNSSSGVNLEVRDVIDQNVSAPKSSGSVSNSRNGSQIDLSASPPRGEAKDGSVASKVKEDVENKKVDSAGSPDKSDGGDAGSGDANSQTGSSDESGARAAAPTVGSNATKIGSVVSGCDLYQGSWVYDSSGPLYTNNTCPVLTQMQNCQGNGRPDKDYESWRWKPSQCELPRFDAKKFLELMRGKTLAFVGDSVARNQMESMLCLLWQVEAPKNRGNRKMQRWYFKSTSVMIVRIWSSWLVHKTNEPFDFAPAGVDKLHLDSPDEYFMNYILEFDVIVLSSGHWFAKQSVYILNNEIVGGQLWWSNTSQPKQINNVEAFGISVETVLTAIATHPNYTGLTIVRSYSPDHYEGGAWNTGGSCTGKEKPLAPGELVKNGFTEIMHEKQVTGFNNALKKATNKSKLRLMDITEAFGYRHDGHPGPYRNPDPNKITKRGPDGRPPPQDCLHWCMPGPVDTWNELVLETIRREFEGNQSSLSNN